MHYLQYIFSICQIFAFVIAEPLQGENVLPAAPSDFPFIVSLGVKHPKRSKIRFHFCTGSLITMEHVLTAAHCLDEVTINQVDVTIGETDWRTNNDTYSISTWIKYNTWAGAYGRPIGSSKNDIAVVKLSSPVNREGIVPVTLTYLNDQQLYRTKAVIVGWGDATDNSASSELLKGKATILTPQKCEDQVKLITGKRFAYQENYLCTFADPYALTTCGDSGGPLLDKDNFLLGITRSNCPNIQWGDFPPDFINQYKVNLHTSINYYREFIESLANVERRHVA